MVKYFNAFLRPYVQFLCMLLLFVFMFYTSKIKIDNIVPIDFKPGIERLDNKRVGLKNEVGVGLNIQNFIEFDINTNTFIAEANLWFVFDPKIVLLDDIAKFSFSKCEIIEKSEPFITNIDDEMIFARYDLRIKFSSNLNYKYFPLGAHELFLTLNNKFLDAHEIQLVSHDAQFVVANTIYMPGWYYVSKSLVNGLSEIKLSSDNSQKLLEFPRIVFSVDVMQSSMRNFIFIVLPMFIMLLVSLAAFSLNVRSFFDSVINVTVTGIAGLLAYRYVIDSISPKVSYYMLSDHIFTLFLLIMFMIFFFDIFYRQKLDKYRGLFVGIIYLLTIFGWSYLMFVW